MQPVAEVIDLSNTFGTPASFVVVGFDTLVPLALLVWAVWGFWRANRRWKEGDRLAREAILLDRLPPSGVVALQGQLRPMDEQKSVRVQAGKRHEQLSFPPFLLGLAGGEMVRVEAGHATKVPADLPVVELEAGKDVYVVGELSAAEDAAGYRQEATLATLRPPSASRFIVSADPLGKPYRGLAVANLLLVIVLTLMVLGFSGATAGFFSRLANGKTGMAEILTTKVTHGSRRDYCTAVAKRPDGRRMEAKLAAAACDDPKAAGDVSPGDHVPIVYVPGSGNDQFGTEAGVEGDIILFVVVLLVVVLLLYGFVRRLVSQDNRYVETTP